MPASLAKDLCMKTAVISQDPNVSKAMEKENKSLEDDNEDGSFMRTRKRKSAPLPTSSGNVCRLC